MSSRGRTFSSLWRSIGNLSIRTRYLAAIGQMYLDNGSFREHRVLNPAWVQASWSELVPISDKDPYADFMAICGISAMSLWARPQHQSTSLQGTGGTRFMSYRLGISSSQSLPAPTARTTVSGVHRAFCLEYFRTRSLTDCPGKSISNEKSAYGKS